MSNSKETDVNNLLNTIKFGVFFVKGKIIIYYMTYDDVAKGNFHIRSSVHRRPIEMTDKFWCRNGYIMNNKLPHALLRRDDILIISVKRV